MVNINSDKFICAGPERNAFDKYVPAPYFRRNFIVAGKPVKSELLICGLGFYRLYVNGEDITKGRLASYMSNTEDIVYYDRYQVEAKLIEGENVIGVLLGNGFQNAVGGYTWDFDKAHFGSQPKVNLRLELWLEDGTSILIESDETFLTHSSPIYFDDLWCGEYYDANQESIGWSLPGFHQEEWKPAIRTEAPKGEALICQALPVVYQERLLPESIVEQDCGYLYNFGENSAGVCRLAVRHSLKGQKITFVHGEYLINGKLDVKNIQFVPDGYVQKDIYICKGSEYEEYIPLFTYHGFQYVLISGVTKEQADKELLTFYVMHADLKERGDFTCSDETVNSIQEITRRSTLSNFYFFPTDCPHREKNGWTGDAQLSAEQTLLNFEPEKSYREWLNNIRKSQSDEGMLPGIVPTGGWGMGLGGPAWDAVLIYLPYFIYKYRGHLETFEENKTAIFRYIHYISCRRDKNGLLNIGLGDWCPAGHSERDFKSPVVVTDTALVFDLCKKAGFLFGVLGMEAEKQYVYSLAEEFYISAREHLIDYDSMTVSGNCQTSQAVFLYYGLFTEQEKNRASKELVRLVHEADDHMDTGIIGGRVLFHVLSEHGYGDLAWHLITRKEFPSYGNLIMRGATTLWEDFQTESGSVNSRNHHMWGDVSSWFIKRVAGIYINPSDSDISEVEIRPDFIKHLQHAEAWHEAPYGMVVSAWKRMNNTIEITVELPEGMNGKLILKDEILSLYSGKTIFTVFEEKERDR